MVVDSNSANPLRPRVLVVDDEPAIRKTLRAYLEDEGYEASTLANGIDVIRAVRSLAPNVIILDVMLPGMDGIEVLRRIRQESSVFVLMLSARGTRPTAWSGFAWARTTTSQSHSVPVRWSPVCLRSCAGAARGQISQARPSDSPG